MTVPARFQWLRAIGKRTVDEPIALFTFGLVVIALMQAWLMWRAETVAVRNAQAAQAAANVATEALVASNRPWVQADIAVGGPLFYNINGANFSFKFGLRNVGHSPALHVWIDLKVIAPAIGIDGHYDTRSELRKFIDEQKKRPTIPFGFSLFPGEAIGQLISTTIPMGELQRVTQKSGLLRPTLLGAIEYRTAIDDKPHYTSFLLDILRSDTTRSDSARSDRAPSIILRDDGDIPASDIRLVRPGLDGGYAD